MKGMRNIAPFGLRMPDELREAVSERAKANGRSMNSEIVQILQDALDGDNIDRELDQFTDHESVIASLKSEAERNDYLNNLEKEDSFAAALLRESDEHRRRLIKILGERFELTDLNKKPT
ncbi:Arc family DNA-binding protein [Rouxiella sp. WC2420]|uniref:Arc family DNA-binding protein n=1 Tax=Rouxiella sp. WC2420 TaxID=3234145 RepID=A0AB39VM11_9GAMM